MKAKLWVSLLIIGLVAGLIGGATLAWFTDATEVAPATFTAGTIKVDADEPTQIAVPEGKSINNVNPGDCAAVTWNIVNTGTKAAEFRVKLAALWTGVDESLLGDQGIMDNVAYAPAPGSDWVMYTDEEGEVWLYYTGGPIPGTFNYVANEDGGSEYLLAERTIPLTLVIGFDGKLTNNAYQGATFKLGVEEEDANGLPVSRVEAVQASNGAPLAVFGAGWAAVNAEDYEATGLAADYYAYFATGAGADMPCWKGGEQEPPVEPETFSVSAAANIAAGGSVTGAGIYSIGDSVELNAEAAEGYEFTGWEYDQVLLADAVAVGNKLTFTMPAQDVSVTANFSKIAVSDDISYTGKIIDWKCLWVGPWENPSTAITIKGKIIDFKVNDALFNGPKIVKAYIAAEGYPAYSAYSGEVEITLNEGTSPVFTISYTIPTGDSNTIFDKDVIFEIDGVTVTPTW